MMNKDEMRPRWDTEPTIPAPPPMDAQQQGANGARYGNKDANVPCTKGPRTKTERLDCLTREHQEHPGDPRVRAQIYNEVKEVVDQDPYLEYHAENTHAYRVIDRANEILIVPKERAKPETFPVQRPEPLRKAYRFLLFAALGLVFSGLGAVIFSPFAARYAFGMLGSHPAARSAIEREHIRADRTRAWVIIMLSLVLFAAGLALTYLLWIHIRG